jgi:hypothetical protein
MNLNIFRVLTLDEQAALQQYADQDEWRIACLALKATPEQIMDYEKSAQAFARTTPYPNSRIIAEARRAAKEALLRGKPMPQDAEQALQAAWADELRRMIGL